jgi:hypothetical protein
MNKDVVNLQRKIGDLTEMLLLKQREMDWIIRRISYHENEIYIRCPHEWINLKCKYCDLHLKDS